MWFDESGFKHNGPSPYNQRKLAELRASMTIEEKYKEKVEEAICRASMLTTLRIGDFVAVELAPAAQICDRSEEETKIKAVFEENDLFDFKLIF